MQENKELKKYIENIKERYQTNNISSNNSKTILREKRNILGKNHKEILKTCVRRGK